MSDHVLYTNALVYLACERSFMRGEVLTKGNTVVAMGACGECDTENARRVDLGGALLCPGLVDAHTHGRAGYDFVDATLPQLHRMAESYLKSGVTTLYPTLATAPMEALCAASDRIRSAGIPQFAGIHLEARFLCPAYRGAHDEALLAAPNADELQRLLPHLGPAPHITAALEMDADGTFTQTALAAGATLSLGHTGATYEQARAAFDNGATALTHTFNAMPPLHHRAGGPICAAFEMPVYTEFICDGIHIRPEMIKLAYAAKEYSHFVLVTDSLGATGMPDGNYCVGSLPVIVKGRRAETPDGHLAGSTLSLWEAVNNLARFCDIPIEQALYHATLAPARELGLEGRAGEIRVGAPAAFLIADLCDGRITPRHVVFEGVMYDCGE